MVPRFTVIDSSWTTSRPSNDFDKPFTSIAMSEPWRRRHRRSAIGVLALRYTLTGWPTRKASGLEGRA